MLISGLSFGGWILRSSGRDSVSKTIVQLQLLRSLGEGHFPLDEWVIALGLRSEAWEVRMTAVLVACRLKLEGFHKLIRNVEIPHTSRSGLDAGDRRLHLVFRKAALALLVGATVPADCEARPVSREMLERHVLRCVAGAATRWHDRIWWWTHTLTTPVVPSLPPTPLPAGIVVGNDGHYRLALTEIELVWVGPGAYWLGDERTDSLRLVQKPHGFFIARRPVAPDYTQPAEPPALLWPDALALCERIGLIEQLPVELPSTDEWEIAARGVDGRRFPWGNGYEPGMLALPAPCGALLMVGSFPQWTHAPAPPGQNAKISGDAADLHCSVHRPAASATDLAVVRPVIKLER
jgi:hypothetical protein